MKANEIGIAEAPDLKGKFLVVETHADGYTGTVAGNYNYEVVAKGDDLAIYPVTWSNEGSAFVRSDEMVLYTEGDTIYFVARTNVDPYHHAVIDKLIVEPHMDKNHRILQAFVNYANDRYSIGNYNLFVKDFQVEKAPTSSLLVDGDSPNTSTDSSLVYDMTEPLEATAFYKLTFQTSVDSGVRIATSVGGRDFLLVKHPKIESGLYTLIFEGCPQEDVSKLYIDAVGRDVTSFAIEWATLEKIEENSEEIVLLESVKFPQDTVTLHLGSNSYAETAMLTPEFTPSNAVNTRTKWEFTNAGNVLLNEVLDTEAMRVTASYEGTSVLTLTVGGKTTTCTINVKPVLTESIILDKTSLELTKGESTVISATIAPANARDKQLTWTTDAPAGAIVIEPQGGYNAPQAKVTVRSEYLTEEEAGKTFNVTATAKGGTVAVCKVKLPAFVPVTAIYTDYESMPTLAPGEYVTLGIVTVPENASDQRGTFVSTAPNIVSCTQTSDYSAVFTALADGWGTFTLTSKSNPSAVLSDGIEVLGNE